MQVSSFELQASNQSKHFNTLKMARQRLMLDLADTGWVFHNSILDLVSSIDSRWQKEKRPEGTRNSERTKRRRRTQRGGNSNWIQKDLPKLKLLKKIKNCSLKFKLELEGCEHLWPCHIPSFQSSSERGFRASKPSKFIELDGNTVSFKLERTMLEKINDR